MTRYIAADFPIIERIIAVVYGLFAKLTAFTCGEMKNAEQTLI